MKINTFLYIVVFILFFCGLVSCGKKWKETTEVNFIFEINDESNGYIQFDEGYIILQDLGFSGDREQGKKDVDFEQNYYNQGEVAKVSLAGTSNNSYPVEFDIPQGTYTSINIQIETFIQQGDEYAILLTGTFINDTNNIPLRFEFNQEISFTIRAETQNGNGDIVFVEDKPAEATVILDPIYWFGTVSKNMLENASIKNIQGTPTLVINHAYNSNIYDMVVGRITDGNKVIFKQ